jgi:hypothetical protein
LYFAFTVVIDYSKGFSFAKQSVVVKMMPSLFKKVNSESLLRVSML